MRGVCSESVRIIRRGNKSLGYGFVSFTSAEDAEAAVAQFNGFNMEEREINCEIARARDESAETTGRQRRRRKAGGGRKKRRPRDPDALDENGNPRNPSMLAAFVANIPFSLDSDETFLELFAAFNPVQAHLVRPRHGGRPKGFGFVKFATHADQLAAIEGMNDVDVDGRPIVVKAALSDNPYEKYIEDQTAAEAGDEADEAVADAPADEVQPLE